MRASTQKLVDALEREVTKNPDNEKLKAIFEEAKEEAFNDYFGKYDLPQLTLVRKLREAKAGHAIIINVINGVYDGTKEEADEWAASPEGQAAFRELMGE